MLIKERYHTIVEQVRGGDRVLLQIEFAEGDAGVGVDEGLPIDTSHAFDRADVERVLGAEVSGMSGFDFAVGLLLLFRRFQRGDLSLGQLLLRQTGFEPRPAHLLAQHGR